MKTIAWRCDAGLSLDALGCLGGAVGASLWHRQLARDSPRSAALSRRYDPHDVRRKLFSLVLGGAAAVLLMLCVATCVAWVQSYWKMRDFACGDDQRAVAVVSTLGRVGILINEGDPGTYPSGFWWRSGSAPPLPMSRAFFGLGDEWWRFDGYVRPHRRALTVPAWAVALTTALLPVASLHRRRASHRRRRAAGLCPTCGYDLRATPDRCPECGTELEAKDEG